jgi:nitrogen fixation/metabolism regulation signal transduction histidine kinase
MRPSRSLDRTLPRLVLIGGLPGAVATLAWLWLQPHTPEVRWTVTVAVLGCWLGSAVAARDGATRTLNVLANLLAALREGDYSVRGAGAGTVDALGLVMLEINALGDTLQSQRLETVEAAALLRTVIGEIDVGVFAFDGAGVLRLVNRAGERLLGRPAEAAIGRSADMLGLSAYLGGPATRTSDVSLPGAQGRWEVRRGIFRQNGLPHQLLVFTDLSQALREEERQAWQRLIRVLGHEINNSLTPIKSIARSLRRIVVADPLPTDWHEEVQHGLTVIEGRSGALSRFMAAYARLARLPKPHPRPVLVAPWVQAITELEKRLSVVVVGGPPTVIAADPDQLDQLLINLVRNGTDAALDTGGGVRVSWRGENGDFELLVEDDGPGLSDTANLFVPFFTTKPNGSGIGLVLSRQIAEAHGGTLTLENRAGARGCVARLRLPATTAGLPQQRVPALGPLAHVMPAHKSTRDAVQG